MNDLFGNIKYMKVEILSGKLRGICQMEIHLIPDFLELLIPEFHIVGLCRFVHM